MRSPFSCFCAFFGYYKSGGKEELGQIFQTVFHNQTTITNDPYVECAGRVLAFTCEATSVAIVGGFVFDVLRYSIASKEPPIRQIFQAFALAFLVWVFTGFRFFRAEWPHTTQFTRRCVRLVDELAPKAMRSDRIGESHSE